MQTCVFMKSHDSTPYRREDGKLFKESTPYNLPHTGQKMCLRAISKPKTTLLSSILYLGRLNAQYATCLEASYNFYYCRWRHLASQEACASLEASYNIKLAGAWYFF